MFQTAYSGILPLHSNQSYIGGFCEFWYIPKEKVSLFPRMNSNQQLVAEPTLVAGGAWYGPIKVPNDRLGYVEDIKFTRAGHYYEARFEGLHTGESVDSRINLQNMPFHKYLLVGKVRAGGFYMLLGTVDSPLRFTPQYKSGNGAGETAATVFSFFTEHISKGYILPSFAAAQQSPTEGGSDNTSNNMANQREIIPFLAGANTSIALNAARLAKFGVFPLIEVWLQDDPGEQPYLHFGGEILTDAPPPAATEITVKPGGNVPGFIVLG